MEKITSTLSLKEAIRELEFRQAEQGMVLRESFILAWESLKPVNVIKNILSELMESNGLAGNVVGSALGMTAGFVSKKLFLGSSVNQLKNIFSRVIQLGAALVMTEKPVFIQSFLRLFVKSVFGRRKSPS